MRFQSPSSSHAPTPITVARGDGIGPEIMDACLRILAASGARIAPEFIDIGEQVYLSGNSTGIAASSWASLRSTKVFFKSPITTPQGGGYKSLNVTVRKTLGLYANVRPCVAYAPFVDTHHPKMDVVIVRENEEDLYAGIEHRQTDEVYQCLKLITRPGCEKIVRYAFDYARANGRKKVTCMTKDNIMKMTDGLFHAVFDEVRVDYPEIAHEHIIIDIGCARLATRPEMFDVIVTPNLYGDIISDVAADLTGSVGLGGSANIGEHVAMFEAIHGSAPDLAGQDKANPSGLLLSAVMMLVHIGQPEIAEKIHNAWLATLEAGIHTPDLHGPHTAEAVGTQAFADAVIARLGQKPATFKPVVYSAVDSEAAAAAASVAPGGYRYVRRPPAVKKLVGVDVFIHAPEGSADYLAGQLNALVTAPFNLQMITNRGVKVWPGGFPETFCTDHWRCRFTPLDGSAEVTTAQIITLLEALAARHIDFIKTEHLCTFDGERGYALGQGQ